MRRIETDLGAYRVRAQLQGEETLSLDLNAGKGFRLRDWSISHYCQSALPERIGDLLRIAMAVFVVDRLVKRRRSTADHGWCRDIHLMVEVSDPEFWNDSETRDILIQVGDVLGGEFWDFSFLEMETPRQRHFRWPDVGDCRTVCLYSGGLDSAAGLVARIRDDGVGTFIPVTVWHQARQRRLVESQLRRISSKYGAVMNAVVVKAALIKPPLFREQERTQRCRSFLFAAVGGAVAAVLGASAVEVYESGIGAVNLPLMTGMWGSKATKGSHPKFLALMSRLLTLTADRAITLKLPFLFKTKAEVVKALRDEDLVDLANETVSCVHYPRRDRRGQCGVCFGCISRRQALAAAGIQDPPAYRYDLFGLTQEAVRVPPKYLTGLKAVLWQVEHLYRHGSNELPGRLRRHLQGTDMVENEECLTALAQTHHRYGDEWLALAARGRRAGWPWADLLTADSMVA
ncbi:MAG: 7-cyano-7-deazaguanine synthase [Planctomycetes bacterium]|nr:7-cyano-7-deazaguanine synthase [Planctomycetota bacterium]